MVDLKLQLDEIQKKARERTVKTQNIEYDLETLVKKIQKGVIKLNPDYQRKHRWSRGFSSRLIESLILNIPIPTIYISQDIDVDEEVEDEIARYSVIDGQQRLTAIYEFLKNKFALDEMDVLDELNGLKYSELPPFLIRRLEERSIKCLRIDSIVDSQVKYDIFERLNSGSVRLEPQELRNASCRGPFREMIKKLAKENIFLELCQLDPGSKRVEKMEDEELILRFFALTYKDGYLEYKSKFKDFLTSKMKELNLLDEKALLELEKMFYATFKSIKTELGSTPFAKYKQVKDGYKLMSKFNSAVFDAIIVAYSKKPSSKKITYSKFQKLFSNKEFFNSVEGSVNDSTKLKTRINKTIKLFK